MKKVGIVTLFGNFNYGNKLQNYALEKVLYNQGLQAETIVNIINNSPKKNVYKKVSRFGFKKIMKIVINKINNVIYLKSKNERTEIFKEFNKDYLTLKEYTISPTNIPNQLLSEYDYFFVGSDQVWNTSAINKDKIYFLYFSEKEKNISYAASFGVSEIPESMIKDYKEGLLNFEYISVREQAGVNLVKEIINKDAELVVDPTMLLTKDEWLKIAKKPKYFTDKKYILTYFLGGISKERNKFIKQFAKKYNLDIINLADIKEYKHYISGPCEFLYYIKNAQIFFTDSFHGGVFSIIFSKPFYILQRDCGQEMNSRLQTLLNKFNLEDRNIKGNLKEVDQISFDINFKDCEIILKNEREKSFKFLQNAMKNK